MEEWSRSMSKSIYVFYSYAPEDEDLRVQLEKHLTSLRREGSIEDWHHHKIQAGEDRAQAINSSLNRASIILLLISADFLASDYCYSIEMTRALERHAAGSAYVIPILLRPADWKHTPFGQLQALPRDGIPVTSWRNQDEAFLDITQGIRRVIAERFAPSSVAASIPLAHTPQADRKAGFFQRTWVRVALLVSVIVLVICGIFFATTSAGTRATFPPAQAPTIEDPLLSNADNRWAGGPCQFTSQGYQVTAKNYYYPCDDRLDNFTNGALRVKVRVDSGSSGGILFRANTSTKSGYIFAVDRSGNYEVLRADNGSPHTIREATGQGSPLQNLSIGVLANGSSIRLYINDAEVYHFTDASYTSGSLSLIVDGAYSPHIPDTRATFSDLKIWNF